MARIIPSPGPIMTATSAKTPKERMAEFEQIILGDKQTFAMGGTIPVDQLDPAKLAVYYSSDMQESHILRFPATESDIAKFYDKASPSPFGKNDETVFDESYRQAREYKPPNFALSRDLALEPEIAHILASNLMGEGQVEATLNKANVYATGGFFKEHRDTPLGRDHIGTITFCLPPPFTGGELVVSQDGTDVVFDWERSRGGPVQPLPVVPISDSMSDPTPSAAAPADGQASQDATPSTSNNLITWAFLYADVCHQVLPVTSGTRLTVAYDVWYRRKDASLSSTQLNTVASPIKDYLISLLSDTELFLPKGGYIAFGARHAYPIDQRSKTTAKGLRQRLKGKDAMLVGLLEILGLSWDTRAVYNADYNPAEYDDPVSSDEESNSQDEARLNPLIIDRRATGERYELLTGCSFQVVEGAYLEDDTGRHLVIEGDASFDKDLIWITEPGAYGHRNAYVAYGNEASSASLYIGVGIVVRIPPAAERERFGRMGTLHKKRKVD